MAKTKAAKRAPSKADPERSKLESERKRLRKLNRLAGDVAKLSKRLRKAIDVSDIELGDLGFELRNREHRLKSDAESPIRADNDTSAVR